MNSQPSLRGNAAFTMIELLVVLAIIAVIVTVSIPTIASMTSPKHTLRKEGRKLMQVMTEARAAAMRRKVRVDVRVNPATHEVRVVEAAAYRSLVTESDAPEMDDEAWAAAMTNRFERRLVFDEEVELEAFAASEIVTETDDEDVFQSRKESGGLYGQREEKADVVAVSFTHFGGSNGGGVGLVYKDVRLNIACDVLTGRPKLVQRRAGE